jgi:membrane-associated phospholipid phosphatase
MSDLTHHTPVSGIPEGSRSAQRLKARAGGRSEWLAPRLHRLPSLLVSWIVANVGAVVLAGFMIALGLFTTKVVLANGAISRADERFPEWLAAHRSDFWTHASYVGSLIGDAPVLIPLVGAIALVLAIRRRWRTASFLVQAGLAEALAYSLTVAVIHRDRPQVPRLDDYTVYHSFPSGHVAAAAAVYGALALLLTARFRALWGRIAIWSVAVAFPIIVALSRMYRGEHHPIDVAAGGLMGAGALLAALFAARTARAVAELRVGKRTRIFE